jgi:hypothetical protein
MTPVSESLFNLLKPMKKEVSDFLKEFYLTINGFYFNFNGLKDA